MAKSDWVEIYRAYEAADLNEEMAQLKKDLKGAFSSQGVGSVSHSRDLQILQDRLGAATRVINERKARASGMSLRGWADFSDTGLD